MSEEQNKENDIEAMEAALKKANEEAKRYRLESKELSDKLEQAAPFAEKYLKTKAEYALTKRGIKDPERVVPLLKLEGEEGIDDAIDALAESLPELFDPKARVSSIDAADKDAPKTAKTATDTLTQQLLKRRG